MLDLEGVLQKIEENGQMIMTTQDLLSCGLNKYYIKKAYDNGRLTKVARGTYQVSRIKKRNDSFQEFAHFVLKKDFKSAYETLLVNMENQVTHEYDNHLRLYFILLAKILGYDDKLEKIKHSEQLLVFCDSLRNEKSYYSHFLDFQDSVLCGNFQQAFSEIGKFKNEQKKRTGRSRISTTLFCILTETITGMTKQENQAKKPEASFRKFASAVSANDFEKAYEALLDNMKNRVTYDRDNNLRLYFLLLDAILGTKTENVKEIIKSLKISHLSSSLPYYSYFESFQNYVLTGDFSRAFPEIAEFRKKEREDNGFNRTSTGVFYVLTTVASRKQQQQCGMVYNNFLRIYQQGEYDQAIQLLNDMLPSISCASVKVWMNNLINLLTTCLELSKNKIVLEEVNLEYGDQEGVSLVQQALENKDYIKAYQNIGKCVYEDPGNRILKLYQELLYKIMNKNKENVKNQRVYVLSPESKKSVQNFTLDQIYELVHNKEYDQLREYFTQGCFSGDTEKVGFFVKRLLYDMDNIAETKKYYDSKKLYYQYSLDKEVFKYFFEALRYKDYQEAYQAVLICEEITAKWGSSVLEFTIYRHMIEDILEKLRNYELSSQLQEKIETYLVDKELSQEDSTALRELLEKKIKNRTEDQDVRYDVYALQLMEMLDVICTQGLTLNDFSQFQYKGSDLVNHFFEAMNLGDYVTALQCITNRKWYEQTRNHPNMKYLIFYKRLLFKINMMLNKKEVLEVRVGLEKNSNVMYLEDLATLKTLVKKANYSSAYHYFQNNFSKYDNMKSKEEFGNLLFLLDEHQRVETIDYLKKYQYAISHEDFLQAKECLDLYREKVQNTGLDRNLDYYDADLQSREKESNSSSFVKKEQLYDYAKYLFDNKEYQKCIEQLNEYLLLDEEMSAKGYFLRGRAFENLGQYDEAKVDYERAISIVPDPRFFQAMGKLCYGQENYQDGINNLLESEKREPRESYDNLLEIARGYQSLGDSENASKYHHLAEQVKEEQAKQAEIIDSVINRVKTRARNKEH